MGLIQLRKPWRQQPLWSAAAAPGVSALWSGASAVDSVGGRTWTRSSLADIVPTQHGLAIKVAGTGSLDRTVLNCDGADKPGAGDFTAVIRFRFDGNGTAYAALGRWNTGLSLSTCDWYLGAPSTFAVATVGFSVACGSSLYTASAAAAWSIGGTYTLIGVRRGTTISVHRLDDATNAIARGSTTNVGITTINAISERKLKLGEIDAGKQYNANLSANVIGLLPFAATDAQINELLFNPWQLFAPRRILISVAAAASGPPTLTSLVASNITTTGLTLTVN